MGSLIPGLTASGLFLEAAQEMRRSCMVLLQTPALVDDRYTNRRFGCCLSRQLLLRALRRRFSLVARLSSRWSQVSALNSDRIFYSTISSRSLHMPVARGAGCGDGSGKGKRRFRGSASCYRDTRHGKIEGFAIRAHALFGANQRPFRSRMCSQA